MPTELRAKWANVGLETLPALSEEIWALMPKPCILTLDAEMGSGKTTLVRHLLGATQIDHFQGSPTFAIVNSYKDTSKGVIYHLDCYRIENEQEVLHLGLEDLLDSAAYIFIEWPEKIQSFIPKPHFRLYIRIESDLSREMTLYYDY
jgi:tRNA threonylcarbamoyladenosine biosynthesis protein TsaE